MFEKYRLALTSPIKSPLAPLFKGGTGLLVPLFKGDLAVRYGRGSPAHSATRQGDLPTANVAIRLFKQPLKPKA